MLQISEENQNYMEFSSQSILGRYTWSWFCLYTSPLGGLIKKHFSKMYFYTAKMVVVCLTLQVLNKKNLFLSGSVGRNIYKERIFKRKFRLGWVRKIGRWD